MTPLNVLLIGSGGREHALAWAISASPLLGDFYCAPGNPGIAQHATCVALDVTAHQAVISFCHSHKINFVVVGPEAPLVAGPKAQHSSKVRRASPRISAPSSISRPAATAASPTGHRRSIT
jgi:phosphoribosylamine-glycine ligase